MQDNSVCKCKSAVLRTPKKWPEVLVVSLHQLLNSGRQDLLCAGNRAIHDPARTAKHNTCTDSAPRYPTMQCREKLNSIWNATSPTEPRWVLIMWTCT